MREFICNRGCMPGMHVVLANGGVANQGIMVFIQASA